MSRITIQLVAALLTAFIFHGCVYAPAPVGVRRGEFRGSVVNVIDGDTIEVSHNDAVRIVDLCAIDAPDRKSVV